MKPLVTGLEIQRNCTQVINVKPLSLVVAAK